MKTPFLPIKYQSQLLPNSYSSIVVLFTLLLRSCNVVFEKERLLILYVMKNIGISILLGEMRWNGRPSARKRASWHTILFPKSPGRMESQISRAWAHVFYQIFSVYPYLLLYLTLAYLLLLP
jgi:hypothetical protein